MVDMRNQCYHWNQKGEHGDVIHWVVRQQKLDFKEAVNFFAGGQVCRSPTGGMRILWRGRLLAREGRRAERGGAGVPEVAAAMPKLPHTARRAGGPP